jgi:NAD(P)-dependent dehydrogenase (short-subunit alcohol dehydrogenase family)
VKDDVFIVNGATGSIGTALTQLICADGRRVIGIGRSDSDLEILSLRHENFTPYKISDVASSAEAINFLDFISSNFPTNICSYIHLSGVFTREIDPISESNEVWHETISTNLTGTYIWNKMIVDYFIQADISGSIVNTSSQAAYTGGFGPNFSYAASKGGIISLSKSLSRYCAQYDIRVNTVVPGFVKNEMMMKDLNEEQEKFFTEKTSLKRLASDSEVAQACLFLAKPESGYSTGIALDVTGGLLDV